MNLEIIQVEKTGVKNVSAQDMLACSGPVLLFVGGLMHLGKHDNGDALHRTLQATAGEKAEVFYVQEKKETSWRKKIYDGVTFETTGSISATAKIMAESFLLPDPALAKDISHLKGSFSKMTLLG